MPQIWSDTRKPPIDRIRLQTRRHRVAGRGLRIGLQHEADRAVRTADEPLKPGVVVAGRLVAIVSTDQGVELVLVEAADDQVVVGVPGERRVLAVVPHPLYFDRRVPDSLGGGLVKKVSLDMDLCER